MIHDIVFRAVGARGIARVPCSVDTSLCVLMEYAAVGFGPGLILHGIIARQFKHADAVERGVDACGGVEDEILACSGVDQLFGPFVSSKADGPTVGDLLPGLIGDGNHAPVGQVGDYGPRVGHLGYA